jgi:hypothetical protein
MQPEAVIPEIIKTAAIAAMAIILAGVASANSFASCFKKTPWNTSKLTGEEWVCKLAMPPEAFSLPASAVSQAVYALGFRLLSPQDVTHV